jgi:hypothetical protein
MREEDAMKKSTQLFCCLFAILFWVSAGNVYADWDPANKQAVIKLSHEIDQMLHNYHKELGQIGLKNFDMDFDKKVHELDHAIHDFHELLSKNGKASAELILEDFKGIELKFREADALFRYLAHRVHSNKKAGLGWMDFL